jgi:hypothetical protein
VAQTVQLGSNFDVGVVVGNVADLGAFQFSVTFDPAVLTPLDASVGSFLGSTGRTVLCVPPVLGATSVQFSCGTLGSEPPPGPSGSGVMATVHFQATAAGTSAVTLDNTIITDLAGNAIPAATESGSVSVSAATPTPCAGPCPTPTSSPTPTATPPPPLISCPGTASATVCLVPQTQTVAQGSTFTVNVVVDRASNIASYQFRLTFDPTILTAVTAVDAGFLGSTERTVVCVPPQITSTTITLACATVGATPPGPTAPGILATVTLTASAVGTSALQFTQSTLSDPLANPIPVTAINGSVTVQ